MNYWAVATGGSGGNAHAAVYGPYPDVFTLEQRNGNFVVGKFEIEGNQGGYATRLEAQAEANHYNSQGSHPPVPLSPANPNTGGGSNPLNAVMAPFKGLEAVGAFFNKLSEANTWLRIGEGLLGIVLIAVGLAKLTGVENFITKNMPAVIPI
jgi:hypothetical protein